MASGDFSRTIFDPKKRYSGVRLQQGTIFTDSDYNSDGEIRARDTNKRTLDLIGPYGTSNDGFLITDVDGSGGPYDFTISRGTYYVGGRRVEVFEEDLRFSEQSDWLLQSDDDREPPTIGGIDLVYLEVWEQIVSADEDGELREVALGGPQTAARTRQMYRVRLKRDVEEFHCQKAWQQWVEAAEDSEFDEERAELISHSRLKVGFEDDPDPDTEDWCTPSRRGGFLGAENQTLRVQIVDEANFTWGFDNGGPLYRAKSGSNGDIELLTPLRDQMHWPLAEETIELLAPAAVLENGERLAELSGDFTQATKSWDPDEGTFSVDSGVLNTFLDRLAENDEEDFDFFVRIWKRDTRDGTKGVLAISEGPIPLGGTGLTVEFSTLEESDLRSGDFWFFSVRPHTRDLVFPWSMNQDEEGESVWVPPVGPRRFFAPLATIEWPEDESEPVVRDCRSLFPILPNIYRRTCTTFTVGDGIHSHGDFDSIATAVDRLEQEGGKIHILPGFYDEQIVLDGRRDIHITGCGDRTQWINERDEALITIKNSCSQITIENLSIESMEGPALLAVSDGDGRSVESLRLNKLILTVGHHAALFVDQGFDIEISQCDIHAHGSLRTPEAAGPAVVLQGEKLAVVKSTIRGFADLEERQFTYGGLQICGGSTQVRIASNRIEGGCGSGVLLGSFVPAAGRDGELFSREVLIELLSEYDSNHPHRSLKQIGHVIADYLEPGEGDKWSSGDGSARYYQRRSWWAERILLREPDIYFRWTFPRSRDHNGEVISIADGAIENVEIRENQIRNMGGSGIESALFYHPIFAPLMVFIDDVEIRNNELVENAQLGIFPVDEVHARYATTGGIVLSGANELRITDNQIRDNSPVGHGPHCGIFVLFGRQIDIERNIIIDELARDMTADFCPQGGIYVEVVSDEFPPQLPPGAKTETYEVEPFPSPLIQRPSFLVNHNDVDVHQGYALRASFDGHISITHNSLISRGNRLIEPPELVNEAWFNPPLAGRAFDLMPVGLFRDFELANAGQLSEEQAQLLHDRGAGAVVSLLNRGEAAHYILQRSLSEAMERTHSKFTARDISRQEVSVSFHGNRVAFAPPAADQEPARALATTFVHSFGDISFVDNHCSYNQSAEIFSNAVVTGSTTRVTNNRFRRTVFSTDILKLSALTLGALFNTTTDNHGDHCFLALADDPSGLVARGNLTRQPNCRFFQLPSPGKPTSDQPAPKDEEEKPEKEDRPTDGGRNIKDDFPAKGETIKKGGYSYANFLDQLTSPTLDRVRGTLESGTDLRLAGTESKLVGFARELEKKEESQGEKKLSKKEETTVNRLISALRANLGEKERIRVGQFEPGEDERALVGHVEFESSRDERNLWAEIVDPSGKEVVASRVDELGNFTITIPESSKGDLGLRIMDRDAKEELFNEGDVMGERSVVYRDIRLK